MASASFEPALTAVLKQEGGYSDHPADPGGATMMGITQGTLEEWRGRAVTKAEVRALSRTEADAIYRKRYWDVIAGDRLPAGIDLVLFDFAVNSGPSRAIRMMQRHLGVATDGRMGPETLAALEKASSETLIAAISAERLAFLKALPSFATFGRGWSRRVQEIETAAHALARQAPETMLPREAVAVPRSPTQPQKETSMDLTKGLFLSRTVWANAIGVLALILSWFGFDTSSVDKSALTDTLLQIIAGASFVASTVFRVIATRRIA